MLRREAATWLVRLRSGSSPDTEERFRRWYEADPKHAAAFDRVSESYAKAGLLRHSEGSGDRLRPPLARPSPRLAIAAAIALLLFVPAALMVLRDGSTASLGQREPMLLVTRVGEIRPVTLADGTKVILDTDSQVEVHLTSSRRRAELRQGRARFEVAEDSRPFLVQAGTVAVRSSGRTEFDVEQLDGDSHVEMISGRAVVSGSQDADGSGGTRLGEGETMSAADWGQGRKDRVPERRQDWTHGMLQFDATPLADAVRQANRYSSRKIVLSGGAGDLRVTGAFRAGDTAGLARSLASAFDLTLDRAPSGQFILSPKPARDGQRKK